MTIFANVGMKLSSCIIDLCIKDGKTELEKVSDIFSANRFQDNEV